MTRLWWIRHLPIHIPEHLVGCYIGQSDVDPIVPTKPSAMTQSLPQEALWFSSPLKRATATAEWLNAIELQLVPELKEQYFGTWEGRHYDEVWSETQHAYDWEQPELIRPPKGESFADLCSRVDCWLNKVLNEHADQSIIIVAHAGVIRAGLRHALTLSYAEALIRQVDHASVTEVHYP